MADTQLSFSRAHVASLTNEIILALNQSDFNGVEKGFALATAMKALGITLYDRSDHTHEAVLKDFKTSPSYGAMLILVAESFGEVYSILTQEAIAPEENKAVWNSTMDLSEKIGDLDG